VPLVALPMGLAVGEIVGPCVSVIVWLGILVELSRPPKGGEIVEIVVVGATVGEPGLVIGAAVAGDTGVRVSIEKDIEKLADFDPLTAVEKK